MLDPDFYIVRENWIQDVVGYIDSRGLSFMGVPWHPKYAGKYRYFPAVHCFFADTESVSLDELDFRPDYPDGPDDSNYPNGYPESHHYFAVNPFVRLMSPAPVLRGRKKFYTDTGGRLYKKFVKHRRHQYGCFVPVFRRKTEPSVKLSWKGHLLEKWTPKLGQCPK